MTQRRPRTSETSGVGRWRRLDGRYDEAEKSADDDHEQIGAGVEY